ncbi:hypothetical protein [Azospirillum sp. ST 5-10]|uniref:hypothetical protein n=1 Tax=unclassified Azospirillum TaxID=2630922 RepID=UPI003F4A23A2
MPADETMIKVACIRAAAHLLATTPIAPKNADEAGMLAGRIAWAMWKEWDQRERGVGP